MPDYSSIRTSTYSGDYCTFTPNYGEVIISAVPHYNPSTGLTMWFVSYGIPASTPTPPVPYNAYGPDVLYELEYFRTKTILYLSILKEHGLEKEIELKVEAERMRREIIKTL